MNYRTINRTVTKSQITELREQELGEFLRGEIRVRDRRQTAKRDWSLHIRKLRAKK